MTIWTFPRPMAFMVEENFYLSENPDVAEAVAAGAITAVDHFNTFGFLEGRDPNPFFDVSFYLGQNQDVAVAGVNPLDHFNVFGLDEERDPDPLYDTSFFLNNEANASIPELERAAVPEFDSAFYLSENPDVAAAVNAGLIAVVEHYVRFGEAEGRDPSSAFDSDFYAETNPDVAAAVEADVFDTLFEHFLLFGEAEGRLATPPEGPRMVDLNETPAATASVGEDIFFLDRQEAIAGGLQSTITGFDPAEDSLQFDFLEPIGGVDSLDDIDEVVVDGGVTELAVQVDQIGGNILVNLGLDSDGNIISTLLLGVSNPADIDVTVI